MATKTARKSTISTSVSQQTTTSSVSSPHVSTSSTERPASPLSPTRMTRLQEKQELANLNDRLAAYIDRVRFLETENSRLSVQLQTTEETQTREVTNIKSMYERELSDARKMLDDIARDKARLQIECDKWKTELEEMQQKLKKREKDLATTEKKLINTDAHNQELQARVNQLQAEKKRLEDILKEAEGERDKLASQLAAAKIRIEEEAIYKVDMLNKLQSMKEELSFKESIHEQEMSESRHMKQTEISDISFSAKDQYEQKLADTLREIREQYETQMKINRDEIETLYETKLCDLQKVYEQCRNSGQSSKEELRSVKSKVESLTTKIKELQSQNDSLKNRVKDLEGLLEQEREWHNSALQAKEDEIKALRMDVDKQLQEYQDLLDIKVALDMEIAAYRKLLEVEESRLNITPFKSPEVQRSTPARRTPLRGKRKRTFLQTGEKSTSDFHSTSSAKGDVEISDHDPEGKFVKLFNKGNTDIPLGAWQLMRRAGEQETVHKFHRQTVIKANSYVTVWSSDAGVSHSPPSDIVMNGLKWFTADSMATVLLNNNGEEMAIRETSKRIHRSSEQRSFGGTDFGEELYHQQGDPAHPQERCIIM